MRVVLGEDLTLLRDGLIRLLTAYDMDVVAAVDDGPGLLRALVVGRPLVLRRRLVLAGPRELSRPWELTRRRILPGPLI